MAWQKMSFSRRRVEPGTYGGPLEFSSTPSLGRTPINEQTSGLQFCPVRQLSACHLKLQCAKRRRLDDGQSLYVFNPSTRTRGAYQYFLRSNWWSLLARRADWNHGLLSGFLNSEGPWSIPLGFSSTSSYRLPRVKSHCIIESGIRNRMTLVFLWLGVGGNFLQIN